MAGMEDFYSGEDLDAILSAIEENILEGTEDYEEYAVPVNEVVEEVSGVDNTSSFHCDKCDKVCKTSRGLTRHKNAKHKDSTVVNSAAPAIIPEDLFHPLHLKKIIMKSATKLANDECYSEKSRKEFANFQNITSDDAIFSYQFIRDVVGDFKGDAEKFYSCFYKCVSDDIIFKNMSKRPSVILGFEVANHVLAHLTKSNVKENVVELSKIIKFTPKEKNIIKYLSGYVFGTLYRRIKRSKQCQSLHSLNNLQLLIAGKSTDSNTEDKNNLLVNAKDRGGLWTVTSEVFEIFCNVETHFRQETAGISRHIDSKKMVASLLKDPCVLYNFNKVRMLTTEKISKEIAYNLLEHLIMLYIRVRVFSMVKDKRELHKIKSKEKKLGSLRTGIKKLTNSLEKGH